MGLIILLKIKGNVKYTKLYLNSNVTHLNLKQESITLFNVRRVSELEDLGAR